LVAVAPAAFLGVAFFVAVAAFFLGAALVAEAAFVLVTRPDLVFPRTTAALSSTAGAWERKLELVTELRQR
jgi:hypothetical protein